MKQIEHTELEGGGGVVLSIYREELISKFLIQLFMPTRNIEASNTQCDVTGLCSRIALEHVVLLLHDC